ncbi:MAG: hypothetical protein ACLRL4_10395 [Bifidobacterium bifidum]
MVIGAVGAGQSGGNTTTPASTGGKTGQSTTAPAKPAEKTIELQTTASGEGNSDDLGERVVQQPEVLWQLVKDLHG